jgi:hypothetical protein
MILSELEKLYEENRLFHLIINDSYSNYGDSDLTIEATIVETDENLKFVVKGDFHDLHKD